MKHMFKVSGILIFVLMLAGMLTAQGTNLLVNGDLETIVPGFWTKVNDGLGGASAEWSWEGGANGSLKSYKVVKPSATSDAVGWMSANNADMYWNNAKGNDTYTIRYWAKTEGVNVNPSTDDAKIGVWFKFYSGGSLLAEAFVPVDQSVASKDWTQYESAVFVSSEPDSMVAVALMGKDATGTVWFDNVYCNSQSSWSMGVFNGDAETPVGWLQWSSSSEVGYVSLVEDTAAHSGSHSALLIERDDNADEIVFYSEPVPVTPGKWYLISGWVRTDSLSTNDKWYPTNVVKTRDNNRLGYCFFYHRAPLKTDWNLTEGDQFFYIDQRESQSGWTYYAVISKAPDDAAGLSMRARFTSFPKGKAWYDDFAIQELGDSPNLLVNADLETIVPGFWTKVNDGLGGASAEWSWEGGANGSLKSYKVVKPSATSDAVGWMSANNADMYWNNAKGNDTYTIRYWAKTEGVNVNPSTDDAKIGVWFKFYSGGSLLAEAFVPVDQSVASKDWTQYESAVFVSSEPDSMVAVALMGKDATGTVWFDNVYCNSQSSWSMGVFNGDAETPVGWLQWSSSSEVGYVSLVEDTAAHSGSHSALLIERDDNADEIVFYSEPVPVTPGKWYLISGWVRTDSLSTGDTLYPTNIVKTRDNDRLGYCFFYHRAPLKTDWNLTEGDQFFYIDQRQPKSGWTYYAVVSQAPADAAGVSMRARFTSFPKGKAWYDDFAIQELKVIQVSIEDPETPVATLSGSYELKQNYPNPFNPITVIEYRVPQSGPVKLEIFNLLGQKVRTLVDAHLTPGHYQVVWDGRDDQGRLVATGVYLYQLRGHNALITKKMMLIK